MTGKKTEDAQAKLAKQQKSDYALHVALLVRMGRKLPDARVEAWIAGPTGLQSLLPLNAMGEGKQ